MVWLHHFAFASSVGARDPAEESATKALSHKAEPNAKEFGAHLPWRLCGKTLFFRPELPGTIYGQGGGMEEGGRTSGKNAKCHA